MNEQIANHFEKMTYPKLTGEAPIIWKLTHQENHKNYNTPDSDITYVSSAWLRMMDKTYYKSDKFNKYFTYVDNSYNFGKGENYAKAIKLTDFTNNYTNWVLENLPFGFFVNNKNKNKFLKKLNQSYSVCPLRQDAYSFFQKVRDREIELSEDDRKAILWLSFYTDETGCLFSGHRNIGERKTYFTPNLQSLKRTLRDLVLEETGHCDVDAERSFHYDYSHLLAKYGLGCLTGGQLELLNKYSGIKGREAVAEDTGLSGSDLKKATLSLLLGGTQGIGLPEKTMVAYTEARKTFTEYLFNQPEFADLDGFDKPVSEWNYDDYGKCLSRCLFRLETVKMETYANLLNSLGYKVYQFMYDGLIIDRQPTEIELEAINKLFAEVLWLAPIKVSKTWDKASS